MRYTEKLEALSFAINCIEQLHGSVTGDEHLGDVMRCPCMYTMHIRRLQDEMKTTRCAIEAVQLRKKVFSAAKLHGSGAPVKVVTKGHGKTASEFILNHTRMMAGLDGNSLVCGSCGNAEYTDVDCGCVMCMKCGYKFLWKPESVICACPSHNDPTGCENPGCWKAVKR